ADVHVVEGRRCCGLQHMNSGDRQNARMMAKEMIAALERVQADYLVAPSSSCAITMAQDYERILADEPEWAERARRLGERIVSFTRFAYNLAIDRGTTGRHLAIRATLHDEPRELLRRVAGVELTEMADSAVCCGFGGTFSFEHPDVANFVLETKLATTT